MERVEEEEREKDGGHEIQRSKEMSFIEIDYLNREETIASDCKWIKFIG